MQFPIVYIMFHAEDRSLNLPLSREVVEKGGFGPPIVGEVISHVSDMHFQIALTS